MQQARLTASDAQVGDEFGFAVSLQGDSVLVGAPADGLTRPGAAYLFVRQGDTWVEQARFAGVDPAGADRFGDAVALHGTQVLVGAPGENATYFFEQQEGAWTLRNKVIPNDIEPGDGFGSQVALFDGFALASAPGQDFVDNESGALYQHQLAPGLALTSLNDGETVGTGATLTLTWLDNILDPVGLTLLKGGIDFRTLTDSTGSDGAFEWEVPFDLPLAADYRLRLHRLDDPSIADTTDTDFTLVEGTDPAIILLWPQGGETIPLGSVQTITWQDNLDGNVGLRLLLDQTFDEIVQVIDAAAESDGSYTWIVPETLPPGDHYFLRVSNPENIGIRDESDVFSLVLGPPSLQIVSPNGGETFAMGSTVPITWGDNLAGPVTIKLLQGGTVLQDLVAETESDGHFDWTVPLDLVPGSDYGVRVTSLEDTSLKDNTDATFTLSAAPPTIRVLSPNGGETIPLGSVQAITWTDNLDGAVTLKLLRAGVLYATIAASTESDGAYEWVVSDTLSPACDYGVRVTSLEDTSLKDNTDEDFCLEAVPTLTVTAPNGGETLTLGQTTTITWTSVSIPATDSVQVRLLQDGVSLRVLQSKTVNDGAHPWTVPTDLLPGSNYQMRVTWTSNTSIKDNSDALFTITAGSDPYIGVLSPNGGEVFTLGETVPITWQDNLDGLVTLRLTKNNVYLRNIRANTESDGHYDWVVPVDLEPGADYKVRITSVEEPTLKDHSNGFFTLNAASGPVGKGAEVPLVYSLEGAYPNPFNPQAVIRYGLPEGTTVRLVVYDVLGREVARLVDGVQVAGWHVAVFDGSSLPSGVYLYRLEAGRSTQARTMLLLK